MNIPYTRGINLQIGDIVYVTAGKKKSAFRLLGKISKFCINPHTDRESCMIEGNEHSFYHLDRLYKLYSNH